MARRRHTRHYRPSSSNVTRAARTRQFVKRNGVCCRPENDHGQLNEYRMSLWNTTIFAATVRRLWKRFVSTPVSSPRTNAYHTTHSGGMDHQRGKTINWNRRKSTKRVIDRTAKPFGKRVVVAGCGLPVRVRGPFFDMRGAFDVRVAFYSV